MQNDMMNDGNVRNHPVRDPSCDDKLGWYKCHGSKTAKCCSKGCLNQAEGEDKPLCDQCNCNGRKWNKIYKYRQKSFKMTEIDKNRIRSLIKLSYFLSPLIFLDLTSDMESEPYFS